MQQFARGDRVTWTQEAIDGKDGDCIDAALVIEGDVLIVVGDVHPRFGVQVQKANGTTFPANSDYLQLAPTTH